MNSNVFCGGKCPECEKSGPLHSVSNCKGHSIGIFCSACALDAREVIDRIAGLHGAYIVNGRYLSSPIGTPDVRSLAEAREYVASRSEAVNA